VDVWAELTSAVEPVTGRAGAAHLRLLGSWGLTGRSSDRIPLTSRRLTAGPVPIAGAGSLVSGTPQGAASRHRAYL
jgi:hypothetical protein